MQIQFIPQKYAKTVNPLCAGNKVFVKYQAHGGVNPNPHPLAYALAHTHPSQEGLWQTEGSCSGVSIIATGNERLRERRKYISEASVNYVQVWFTIKGSLHQFLAPFRAAYNQRRLTIKLVRQAHNRPLEKANENVANQQKHKFYKW